MHNPLGPRAQSREISLRDGLAIVPLVVVILALAFYPQFGLRRSEPSVQATMAPAEVQEGLSPAGVALVTADSPRRVYLYPPSGGTP